MALLKLGLNVPFKAAMEAAEKRRSLMPATYYELPAEMRAQAFSQIGKPILRHGTRRVKRHHFRRRRLAPQQPLTQQMGFELI